MKTWEGKGGRRFTLSRTFDKIEGKRGKPDGLTRRMGKVGDMLNFGLPDYIQHLLKPESYEDPVSQVELLQTHISFIILTDQFVYKWKKDVDLGFLDFSTLEKRKYFCDEELRLNRRLCPDTYLGRVHISQMGKGFVLNGPVRDCVEYGIKMRRLPQQWMMNEIISRGELTREDLQAIVDDLLTFYEKTVKHSGRDRFGTVDAVWQNVYDNLEHVRPFVGMNCINIEQFRTVRNYVDRFLLQKELFVERKRNGFVRDCHGDLHSANICLADEVCIFDCIEFSEDLRITDIAADIAFLAMDLDFHNLSGLSNFFVESFRKASGDQKMVEVLNFYKCYRAVVRGKIGLLTAHDLRIDPAERRRALKNCTRYFKLAEMYCGT